MRTFERARGEGRRRPPHATSVPSSCPSREGCFRALLSDSVIFLENITALEAKDGEAPPAAAGGSRLLIVSPVTFPGRSPSAPEGLYGDRRLAVAWGLSELRSDRLHLTGSEVDSPRSHRDGDSRPPFWRRRPSRELDPWRVGRESSRCQGKEMLLSGSAQGHPAALCLLLLNRTRIMDSFLFPLA